MTNDINIIKQVEKNIGDWISILCEEHFDKINVYNDIDLEGPPPNFKYIATCEYGKDVPRPEDITDFMIGCDCVDGCENEILCSCSVRDNYDVPISFSYNKKGEVIFFTIFFYLILFYLNFFVNKKYNIMNLNRIVFFY